MVQSRRGHVPAAARPIADALPVIAAELRAAWKKNSELKQQVAALETSLAMSIAMLIGGDLSDDALAKLASNDLDDDAERP